MKIPPIIWGVVGFGAVITLILFLSSEFPGSLSDRDSQISLTYSLALLAVLGGSAVVGRRFRKTPFFRYASIWVVLGFGVFTAYSFRDEAKGVYNRLLGELLPATARIEGGNVIIRKASNGHFVVEANVDGTEIIFLVDTGASDVVISPDDANRLGFDPGSLKYTKTYQTANGTVYGAPVRLGKLSIGPLEIRDVRASVNGAAMSNSLLGMSFLERLSGYEVRGNSLFLKP